MTREQLIEKLWDEHRTIGYDETREWMDPEGFAAALAAALDAQARGCFASAADKMVDLYGMFDGKYGPDEMLLQETILTADPEVTP